MALEQKHQLILENWIRTILKHDFVVNLVVLIIKFSQIFERFDEKLTHKKLVIEEDGLRVTMKSDETVQSTMIRRTGNQWLTAIGTCIAIPGYIYTWKCKLVKGDVIFVGCLLNNKVDNHTEYWWGPNEAVAFWSSRKYSQQQGLFHPGSTYYGQTYKEGDIITICLDLKQNKISYGNNKTQFDAIHVDLLKKHELRLVIAFHDSQKCTIIDIVSLDIEH